MTAPHHLRGYYAVGVLAVVRCWCDMHDSEHACPPVVHDAYKRDRAKLERECTFRGAQPDMGCEHWDCHCGGTVMVRTKEAA